MRNAASYLTALSQADASIRARMGIPEDDSTGTSPSIRSSVRTEDDSSTISSRRTPSDDFEEPLNELERPLSPPTSAEQYSSKHSEFGRCANETYRHVSVFKSTTRIGPGVEEDPPYYILVMTYLSYIMLILLGHVRDFFGKRIRPHSYSHLMPNNGYAALNSDFDSFFSRRLKQRMDDVFSRPITGVPGRTLTVLDRVSDDNNLSFTLTGSKTRALNTASYNYLGFAQAEGGCADAVEEGIRRYGVSSCSARREAGTTDLHQQAEALVAKFIGHEDALIVSMGFATNTTTLPALVGKGCLVISDEQNHSSIRMGVRLSGANVRTFKHNDMDVLESLLREVISQGQPRTHRPWKKIFVVVEGLYSMEGTLVNLPRVMELKKKYKFYLYIDEAHSIGALGPNGRGVADYFGINPAKIDILMGTFTKSFGAAGGYIAGSHSLITVLRTRAHATCYSESVSPAVLTQIVASMGSIMGILPPVLHDPSKSELTLNGLETYDVHPGPAPASSMPTWMNLPPQLQDGSEGQTRLRRLAFNSRYLSRGLQKLGFIIYGHDDSPIVPLLLFNPGKMTLFSRLMLARNLPIVVVVVGYPATPLISGRARFCMSAAHTKEDVDLILKACDELGDLLDFRHGHAKERWSIEEVMARAGELVAMEEKL
ncbi:hypothetical protein M422DRAFT_178526 [Sphaerobolus stellatus SS14]|uniref:serine C-palmitoyltransferase n=1 Tax=Sphaerobolus stellatus (strain SS14) TaxID=990650 RepID=A0A0C9UQT8_SPHS4|nr:hypothetical protein M422DRAFT_178526 [Sphaerobolus stellatus SS14]